MSNKVQRDYISEFIAQSLGPKQIVTANLPKHIAFLFHKKKPLQVFANTGNRHAEEACMQGLPYWLSNIKKSHQLTMCVTKVNGIHRCSRPCVECSQKLKKFPQIAVYYTDHEGNWMRDFDLDNSHRPSRKKKKEKNMPIKNF